MSAAGLGVPENIAAFLFDLDGVLTSTASVHAAAWRDMFDAYLNERAERDGERFQRFDLATDYPRHLDGKLREDGVRSFLASRDITLPEGDADDPPTAETVYGLGKRKNELLLRQLAEGRLEPYEGARRYVEAVRKAGLPTAVVSSSTNTPAVLKATGLAELLPVVVDGNVARQRGLAGKPAPDMFLAGAAELGVPPERAAVFEDALAGVAAAHAGGFGYVVGVDRADQARALRASGADVVVNDIGELLGREAC